MNTETTRKEIRVIDFNIGREGVEVSYSFRGRGHYASFSPFNSAKRLMNASIGIEDVNVVEGIVMVKVSYDDEITGEERTSWIEWDQYAFDYGLSQYEALILAANYELDKYYDKHYNTILSPAKVEL